MPNVWSMCAVCAIFIVQFNLPVGCWPLMVGAHNLRLILQIGMQTQATGTGGTCYKGTHHAYTGMSCTPTHTRQIRSSKLNRQQYESVIPYGQHCPVAQLTLVIWFVRRLPGNGTIIHVSIRHMSHITWCTTEPCYRRYGQLVEVDYAGWLLSDHMGPSCV